MATTPRSPLMKAPDSGTVDNTTSTPHAETPPNTGYSTEKAAKMARKSLRRLITAGIVAASLLIAAPTAQAGPCLQCPSGASGPTAPAAPTAPGAPVIGSATSGISGGGITATAAWGAPSNTGTSAITGYRVHASKLEPRFDAASQAVWWVEVSTTTSAVQPASARTLSMPLPLAGTYLFRVQAINEVGVSPYSASSNRVTGQ
jgi:hypothetical protein